MISPDGGGDNILRAINPLVRRLSRAMQEFYRIQASGDVCQKPTK